MSLQAPHSIDDAARAGCTTARGIRFWEESDLLGDVARSEGGTRRFTDKQLDLCRIIAAGQFGGWKIDEIRQMLDEWGEEAFTAILTRLSDQIRLAARLAESLPRPEAAATPMVFDL